MPSTVDKLLFSEPSGWPVAFVQCGSAVFFAGLYLYSGGLQDASSATWLLFMVGGAGLSGLAESLPAARRRTIAVLRGTALLVLVSLLALMIGAPDLVFG